MKFALRNLTKCALTNVGETQSNAMKQIDWIILGYERISGLSEDAVP